MGWNKKTTLLTPVEIESPSHLSATAMRACASFGLISRKTQQTPTKSEIPDTKLISQIRSSGLVLISGASGAGKSCMLRGITQWFKEDGAPRVHVVHENPSHADPRTAMIDLLYGQLDRRVTSLSHAGLAEPRLWAMPESCLSTGERARVQLAKAMHNAQRGDVVIADEFATSLDRASAYSVARTMRRWANRQGITLITAAAHEDMESMLAPDLVIDMNTHTVRSACSRYIQPVRIQQGTIDDYYTLSHLHYLGAAPATHTLVLKAVRTAPIIGDLLAGVLVISMPTLNGSWRDRAWPGVFSAWSKSQNAKRINADLRCISRVIVEPRSRGLGVASALVRAYLSNPQTRATEAIAAMGSVCPFFERAGMQPYRLLPAPLDLRLIDALEHQRITLTDLFDTPVKPGSLVERELIAWSKSRKYIGAGTPDDQTIQKLAPIAACRLLSRPRAYAHVCPHSWNQQGETGDGERQSAG